MHRNSKTNPNPKQQRKRESASVWCHPPLQASAQLLRQLAAVCAGCLTGLAAAAAAPAAPQRPGQHLGTPHTGGSASAAAALHAVMASLLQATADLMGLVVKQVRAHTHTPLQSPAQPIVRRPGLRVCWTVSGPKWGVAHHGRCKQPPGPWCPVCFTPPLAAPVTVTVDGIVSTAARP